ncbi:universal stress protein [Francisellaceae bacterium]|nr:universal stress protein [Francisellaceae bacterium]
MIQYKSALYAIELNAEQIPTIKKTIESVKSHNTKLTLIHVIHPASLIYADASYISPDLYGVQDNLETNITNQAKADMAKLCTECGLAKDQGIIEIGRPDISILENAKNLKVDAIIVNGHKHNIFGRLGSTADAIINQAKCDVIVLKK